MKMLIFASRWLTGRNNFTTSTIAKIETAR